MVEPPSLPYARDESSTSHNNNTYLYPSYTETFETEEEEAENEGSVEEDANAAPQYWAAKRHRSGKGKAKGEEEHSTQAGPFSCRDEGDDILILGLVAWRLRSRLKTFNCGMFICLNIGVDPPDIVKTNPCAKLECWLDPTALPSTKAIDAIGRSTLTSMTQPTDTLLTL